MPGHHAPLPYNPPAVVGSHGATYALPVRMRPQPVVEPGFKTTSLASPSTLSLFPPPLRHISAVGDIVAVPANAYDNTLPSNRIETKGDYLVFRPIWHDAVYDTIDELSYCMYRIDLSQYAGASTIGFSWAENGPPTAEGKYWVGLGNRTRDTWDWYTGPLDSVLTLDALAPYLSPTGELLLLVAMVGRERVVVLREIRVGEPERRGTGIPFDLSTLPDKYPPLFVPTLPASVDLRAGCAPVNDQGTWGACTCFAVGDGAYNYELNALYQGLGWNLANPFNRVSPKYLYVESGKLQGFPPGGDYGRYTDQVAAGLVTHGVATEQNAPYDLVYDDNWSAAALADAALLTTSASYNLPCNTPEGLETIKAVLAHQQRPVVLSTQVDWEFLTYVPGAVWHYTGPSYGGHAMLIVGYDESKQAFLVRNSWSEDWGDNGYLWIGYDTLTNPLNYYVQCCYLTDDYDPAVAQRFVGASGALPPPSKVEASDGSEPSGIKLSWSKSPGATGYEVYRDTKSNLVATVGDVAEYVDATVSGSLARTYWVVAKQGASGSAFSAPDIGYVLQSPVVDSVEPQGGSAGQRVRFIPTAYGSSPLNYTWDFGGGAQPNTSTEAAPLVVLLDEGQYAASVTVSNALGSDTLQFTLAVAANIAPEAQLFTGQDHGIAPYEATLDASGSYDVDGYIVLYEFDWEGDGVYDLVTTESVVTHLYTAIGQYPATVRVMDDAGVQATATSMVYVDPENWPPYSEYTANPLIGDPPLDVHFDASNSYDQDGSITLYEWDFDGDGTFDTSGATLVQVDHQYTEDGSYPSKLRVTDNEGATGERTVNIQVGLGGLPTGWQYYTIPDSGATSAYPSAALVGGHPALVAADLDDDSLDYRYTTVATPTSPADWLSETLLPGGIAPESEPPALTDLAGAPAASLYTGYLSFARKDASNWLTMDVDTTEGRATASAIAVIGGKPAVAYMGSNSGNPWGVYYARATTANPTSPSDWVIVEVEPNAPVEASIALVNIGDVPYIAYCKWIDDPDTGWRPHLARATSSTPGGVGDWVVTKLQSDKGGWRISMVNLAGRPALAYHSAADEVRFAWAKTATPAGPGDWSMMAVDDQGRPSTFPAIGVVASCPAIADYNSMPGYGISYHWATRPDPQGSGDWQTLRFFGGSVSGSDFSVLDAGGKPAIVVNTSLADSLIYLYRTN